MPKYNPRGEHVRMAPGEVVLQEPPPHVSTSSDPQSKISDPHTWIGKVDPEVRA